MNAKTFEIRDKGTFIPMLAVQLNPECEADRYLLSRAGFGATPEQQGEYIMLIRLAGGGGGAQTDPYEWGGDTRTVPNAHNYIINNWSTLKSGDLIDVEFTLGESLTKKISESANGA